MTGAELRFQHFTIADPLPGTAWGTAGIPLADLDGDGDLDTALSRRDAHGFWWYERRTDAEWIQHLVCDSEQVKQSLGATALDVDQDGWTDLVFSFVWFKNPGTGSWHSLGVADFDGDGDLDVFAGEQEDPDTYMVSSGKLPMKPTGLKERGVIWVQASSGPPQFVPQIIQVDNPGWHDACLGDVDGDGDTDIVGKVWNKDGPTYHADYWRNDTVRP